MIRNDRPESVTAGTAKNRLQGLEDSENEALARPLPDMIRRCCFKGTALKFAVRKRREAIDPLSGFATIRTLATIRAVMQ
jgi:hypothetical protein